MTEQQEPEPTQEMWTFGGTRIGSKNQRLHAWIGPDGATVAFKPKGSYTVGSVYAAQVTREGSDVTLHGRPEYRGQSEDQELRERLSALHRAAEVKVTMMARERADKQNDPLDKAVERLAELAKHVPASQRTAFAAHVMTRLMKNW